MKYINCEGLFWKRLKFNEEPLLIFALNFFESCNFSLTTLDFGDISIHRYRFSLKWPWVYFCDFQKSYLTSDYKTIQKVINFRDILKQFQLFFKILSESSNFSTNFFIITGPFIWICVQDSLQRCRCQDLEEHYLHQAQVAGQRVRIAQINLKR